MVGVIINRAKLQQKQYDEIHINIANATNTWEHWRMGNRGKTTDY